MEERHGDTDLNHGENVTDDDYLVSELARVERAIRRTLEEAEGGEENG